MIQSFPKLLAVENYDYQKFLQEFWKTQKSWDGSDLTSKILFGQSSPNSRAKIISKSSGIISGIEEAKFFLDLEKIKFQFFKKDGEKILPREKIVEIFGKAKQNLKIERILLNFLARMSGITTKTNKITKKIPKKLSILSTRKTLWGFLDKKAVLVGGGGTHRINLNCAFLVKENYLVFFKITQVLQKIYQTKKNNLGFGKFWEIEIENENQFWEIIEFLEKYPDFPKPGIIMFDNFSAQKIFEILKKAPKLSNIFFEASGGISEKNISQFVKTGVHSISMGILTNTAESLDFSMQISKI